MIDNRKKIALLLSKVNKFDDQKAFEALFDIYYSWLYNTAIDIVKKKEVAEELVEDVFFKLWETRKKNHEINNLSTYLFVAIKHRAYNHFKKMSKVQNTALDEVLQLPSYLANPEQGYLTLELQEHIDVAIAHLPVKCREVFNLVRLEGLSYKQAAEVLHISPKTVENQLAIAVKKISAELMPYLFESNIKYPA